ncbi:hypothetical protein CHS0354_022885 [Potamilus streckersoni]|uniref:Uncharacterized protein n=1 Tax=Potamilus streckersoni TaxID=2493646 RepID=A0AAE0S2N4_9BIVA|nr:hypothetical protein CHS0354_022885 [Potamilus streckersoni]
MISQITLVYAYWKSFIRRTKKIEINLRVSFKLKEDYLQSLIALLLNSSCVYWFNGMEQFQGDGVCLFYEKGIELQRDSNRLGLQEEAVLRDKTLISSSVKWFGMDGITSV